MVYAVRPVITYKVEVKDSYVPVFESSIESEANKVTLALTEAFAKGVKQATPVTSVS